MAHAGMRARLLSQWSAAAALAWCIWTMDRAGAEITRASADVVNMATAIKAAEQILNEVIELLLLTFGKGRGHCLGADVICPTAVMTQLAAFYFDVRGVTVAKSNVFDGA